MREALLPRRGGVAHRVAGFLDRAVDLAAGFLGGTFVAAGQGKPEEEGGAHDAEDGIGMVHGKAGYRSHCSIPSRTD